MRPAADADALAQIASGDHAIRRVMARHGAAVYRYCREALRDAIAGGLDALSDEARAVVLLRFQQGFTLAELVEICRERPGALQARVAHALPALRDRLGAR